MNKGMPDFSSVSRSSEQPESMLLAPEKHPLLHFPCKVAWFGQQEDSRNDDSNYLNKQQPSIKEVLVRKAGDNPSSRTETQAASVIQRFCRSHFQPYLLQQTVLRRRLLAIQHQKQGELKQIAEIKEKRKIELLLEMRLEQSQGESTEDTVHLAEQELEQATKVEELIRDVKTFKKANAFLQKRCKDLRRRNKELKLELLKHSKLKRTRSRDSQKMLESQVISTHFQHRVSEEQARLEEVEHRLQSCKDSNRQVRQLMGKMVRMVEQLEPEHNDKWDLVDQLYQIQRDNMQKRRSYEYNTPITSCGRSQTKRRSLTADADCSLGTTNSISQPCPC